MVTFKVPDMTCGRCAASITTAIAAVDKTARTEVDVAGKLVRIDSSSGAAQLAGAIALAGYSPQEVQATAPTPAAPSAAGGCCCGSRRAAANTAAPRVPT